MAYLSNSIHSKCTFSVLKYHVTTYGKYYKYEVLSNYHSSSAPKSDVIGPPHPVSNLRPVHFYVPDNEAPIEKKFRLKRQEVQLWNQDFWTRHNTKFVEERKEFIAANRLQNSDTPLSADEMSVFYKAFLDKNWRTHLSYNTDWYKRNAELILLHLRVKLLHLRRRLTQQKKLSD